MQNKTKKRGILNSLEPSSVILLYGQMTIFRGKNHSCQQLVVQQSQERFDLFKMQCVSVFAVDNDLFQWILSGLFKICMVQRFSNLKN